MDVPHMASIERTFVRRCVPLGVELRFLWGKQIVGEHFLHPGRESVFTIGERKGVDFEMGNTKLGGASFDLVQFGPGGATVRFTGSMRGELHRRFGDEVMSLAEAKKLGIATDDGDGFAIALENGDFAWLDLGGIVVQAFFRPAPRLVFKPLAEAVDFTLMNILLVCFFLGALFVISAANRDAEGEAFDDELDANQSRIAKLLIKPAEKQPLPQTFSPAKNGSLRKQPGDEGSMGKVDGAKRSARPPPYGDRTNKDQARLLIEKLFDGASAGVSTVFGRSGLGVQLHAATRNLLGAAPGDAGGLSRLGLRGEGPGGGGPADTLRIGVLNTLGRGGGRTGPYALNAGVLGNKKVLDISIASSEPLVVGSLDKELIRRVINANRNQVRFCYENQLTRSPSLEGKVSIKFIISPEGTVKQSSVAQSTADNAELEACVAGRVRSWLFPKPLGGGLVMVTYPFLFKQSGQ